MENKINNNILLILCFFWFIPVYVFFLNPNYNTPAWPTWLASFVTAILCLIDNRIFSISLPFFALISPLAISSKLFNFLPSELFVLGCFFYILILFLLKGKKEFKFRSGEILLIWLFIFAVISFLLSFEYTALLKPLISWIILLTVFIITKLTLRTHSDHSNFLNTIVIAVVYSSLISLIAFVNAISLNSFISPDQFDNTEFNLDEIQWYFRISSFYTNSSFVIGSAAIISLISIFNSTKIKMKIIYFSIYIFLFTILLLAQEKSGLVGLVTSSIVIIIFFRKYLVSHLKNKKFIIFTLSLFSTIIIYISFQKVSQLPNYVITSDSFINRLCVWLNTMEVLLQNPIRLLFGFGPESSLILINQYTLAAKESCSGAIEGAIDGGHITLLFEYGALFTSIFWLFSIIILYRIYKKLNYTINKIPYLSLFSVILFINIAAIGDVIGTSKITWMITQIFSVTCFYLSNRSQNIQFNYIR